jgi:hypothetical protein
MCTTLTKAGAVALALALVTVLLAAAPQGDARARRGRKPRADTLDPLYRRMAKDLKAGKPLVVTVHVALCSNLSIWCGSKKLGNGDRPGTNLYWGGAAGFTAWFRWNGRRRYTRVYRDKGDGKVVLERVVYRRRVKNLSARWRRFGVNKPFDIYVVGLAYRGSHIGKGVGAFIRQTATEVGSTLKLKSGVKLRIGGLGHVVGYAGHNYLMDTGGRWKWPRISRRKPVGYFMLSCRSAPYVAPRLTHRRTHALLLTRVLMYPGAYTIDGLVSGLRLAQSQARVYRRGCAMYGKHSKVSVSKVCGYLFTHDGRRKFRKRYPKKP